MELTSLARQEKDAPRLLDLQEDFYTVARREISLLEKDLKEASDMESELLEQDILTAHRSLKNLTDLRIKKIVKAAVSDAYRPKPEHALDSMFPAERDLYDCMIKGISTVRKGAGSTP